MLLFPHAVKITELLQWFLIVLQTFASPFFIITMVCPSPIYLAFNFYFLVAALFLLPCKIPTLFRCLHPSTMPHMHTIRLFTGILFLHCLSDPEIQTQETSVSGEADFQLTSPQVLSPAKNSDRRLSLKNATSPMWEITSGMVLILCYFTFQFYVVWGTICCKFQRTQMQFTEKINVCVVGDYGNQAPCNRIAFEHW